MIGLYNSRFVKFDHDESEGILHQTWNYTHDRNDLHFYQSVNQFLYIVNEYKVNKILIDFSNFTFCLDTQSQKWVEQNVIKGLVKRNISRIALVKSKDINTQVSLHTLFNMGISQPINTAFFDTATEAKQWLLMSAKGNNARLQKVTQRVLSGM